MDKPMVALAPYPVSNVSAPHSPADLKTLRLSRGLVVFTPTGDEIAAVSERARSSLPMLTSNDVVERVVSFNPDCLWAIARKSRFDAKKPQGEGFVAFLMLNAAGLRQLRAGIFNAADPDFSLLVPQNEKPAAVYIWAIYAPGALAAGVPLVLQKVWTPLYHDADIYSRSINAPAVRFVTGLGFRKHVEPDGTNIEHLYILPRSNATETCPSYDSYRGDKGITVRTARTFGDLAQLISIRGAVYMAEQACPYEEEFDGNDLSATHLIGMVDDEPAGCVRIRCFANFAKIERLAVRKEFRGRQLALRLAEAAIDLLRMKGYGKIGGHAAHHMVPFWEQFGFRVVGNGDPFVFSDFEYVAMCMDFEPHPNAVMFDSDPHVVLRPEGAWHRQGILERSSARPVTTPSIVRGAA